MPKPAPFAADLGACPGCGTRIRDADLRFCDGCGRPLAAERPSSDAAGRWALIGALIVAAIVTVVVAIVIAGRGPGPTSAPGPSSPARPALPAGEAPAR